MRLWRKRNTRRGRRMNAIDQAFFDCYTKNIAQCDDKYVQQFIEMINQDNANWDEFPSEYYSHLMDTNVAFLMGVEYGGKNK